MAEHDKALMMAIVMLGDANVPSLDALHQTVRSRLPDTQIGPGAANDPLGALLFRAGGVLCGIMRVAAPCPLSANDASVKYAWHWPKAWDELKKHKAHLVLSAGGGTDAKLRAAVLGQLVGAVVDAAPSAIGLSWESSESLWPAQIVGHVVPVGSDGPPLPFCVAVRLSRDARGFISAHTKGLAAFDLMEIATHGYKGDPAGLSGTLLSLASYLIEAGPVIKDGDTIGPDTNTKLKVRYEVSSLTREKVYGVSFV